MPRTPPWLQSILEEHFEELQMLWELRQSALQDADYSPADVAELDERIEAHVDGLVLGADHARPILEEGLEGDEYGPVFSAAYVLLRLNDQAAADMVVEAFSAAQGEKLSGLRDALAHGPMELVREQLQKAYQSGPPAVSAAAVEVVAFHGSVSSAGSRLPEYFTDEDPSVRQAAWRITALTGLTGK